MLVFLLYHRGFNRLKAVELKERDHFTPYQKKNFNLLASADKNNRDEMINLMKVITEQTTVHKRKFIK